jgi:hypothetical protein
MLEAAEVAVLIPNLISFSRLTLFEGRCAFGEIGSVFWVRTGLFRRLVQRVMFFESDGLKLKNLGFGYLFVACSLF